MRHETTPHCSLPWCGGAHDFGALPAPFVPSASAQPCPDVEVVFARGTGEPPGVGPTGQAFVDSVHQRVGARSFGVYPVNYPASDDWATGLDGIRDAGAHVVSMSKECPQAEMVLGGYSQGAAVMGFVTSAAVPDGVDSATVPKPLAPEVADHVAAGRPLRHAKCQSDELPRPAAGRHRADLSGQDHQGVRSRGPGLL